MKTVLNITFSTLLLLFFTGSHTGRANEKTIQHSPSEHIIETNNTGNKIDNDNTQVIKHVYVIDLAGAEIKKQASESGKTLATYPYGKQLAVIEETKEWLGIREWITGESLEWLDIKERDTRESVQNGWEKVYVLKSKTGSFDEITLVPEILPIISWLGINQKNEPADDSYEKTEFFLTNQALKDFLEIELIDKGLFDSKRNSAVNFLTADTTAIKKEKGVIELKCQTNVKKYIDINDPDIDDSIQVFGYIGQFELLNKYLIRGSYYEHSDYKLIDKNSCEETLTSWGHPIISADKKYIIDIVANPFEQTTDLKLYSINDTQIKHVMSTSFKYWMPAEDPIPLEEIFWSTDNYLYLAVTHSSTFWKEDGHLNEKYQYIRIKVL
ncbi:MAG TPA: SH3 domain-containing protein [Pasteurellaceae bacterium]|nr:SH3 domain-containing protein [Pasteurellaceae bacterium]